MKSWKAGLVAIACFPMDAARLLRFICPEIFATQYGRCRMFVVMLWLPSRMFAPCDGHWATYRA